MKKAIFFPLIIMMFLTALPNVHALEVYGTVKDITKEAGDSLTTGEGSLVTDGNTTTIRYKAATFKMLNSDKDASDGNRPGPAAWIGFEITEPSNDQDSKFKVTTPDNKTTEIKTSTYRDYVGITEGNLKNALLNGTMLTYKYAFDWNEDGNAQQYVVIEIDPQGITLIDANSSNILWSPTIAKNILNEQNPNTSEINFFLIFSLIILSGFGLFYYFKKA